MIIGFLGRKRSGKDTAASFIIENYNFTRYAFGDPVKDVCRAMFGFTEEQLYGDQKETVDPEWNITPRQAFQTLGTDIAQYGIYNYIPELKESVPERTFWVKRFEKWYYNELSVERICGPLKVVLSDVRFQHEVDAIKRLNGTIIKIERDSDIEDSHTSENEIDLITNIDYTIQNNESIEEFNEKLHKVVIDVYQKL